MDHSWDGEGVLLFLVRWFGYGPDVDTLENSGPLPVAAVYRYCRRKGLLPQDLDKAAPSQDAQEA